MFVDIHTHILPAMDDGAKSVEEALDMLRIAADAGTTHLVATPHDNGMYTGSVCASPLTETAVGDTCNKSHIEQMCEQLTALAAVNHIQIRVLPGSEVLINPDLPQRYQAGELCTLNKTPFILLELPFAGIPLYLDDVIYRLQLAGAVPILAHPERNDAFVLNKKTILRLREHGVLYQCNAGSLTGRFGRSVKKMVLWMLKNDLAHFIASDAHSAGERSPDLREAADFVAERFGQETMHRLFFQNAEKWILGRA